MKIIKTVATILTAASPAQIATKLVIGIAFNVLTDLAVKKINESAQNKKGGSK